MKNRLIAALVVGMSFSPLAYAAPDDQRGLDRESPLMMADGVAPSGDSLDYQIYDLPGHSEHSPTMVDQRQTGRFVVAKTENDTWSVSERLGEFHVGNALPIPQTPNTTPLDLWSVEGGIGYNHAFSEGRQFGLNFGVGSDSDHPFYSLHETIFRANAFYRLPMSQRNGWIFSLNYSNNRHFFNGIPLPGVGYYFIRDDGRFVGLLGFPYALLRYTPTHDWTLQGSIFGPRNVNAEIARRIVGPLKIYSAFQWGSQEWLIADRQDYKDRLVFDRKRAALGLRSAVTKDLTLDLSGGRQFDQRFFVNDSSSFHDVPTAGFAPTWFVQSKISLRFATSKS